MQPNWNAIRAHYRKHHQSIMSAGRNDFGMDPYAWDGLIELTPIESALWHDIRECNGVFYPQYPVGKFFVDFGNPAAQVAIECDGKAYHLDKEKDRARDEALANLGWTTYRITGSDCKTQFNEEEKTLSKAFLFVKEICKQHQVAFGVVR